MNPISLAAEAATMDEPWSPRLLAACNDQHVKLARMDGAFDWHAHPDADELFLVVDGEIRIEFRDDEVGLATNELHVVPMRKRSCCCSNRPGRATRATG
jgi:mannose-6-phosphate isomerase-like protein (cupin superfamily)